MPTTTSQRGRRSFELAPFAAPSHQDVSVTGSVLRTDTFLFVEYNVEDHRRQVAWPATSKNPSRKDDLWKTTCLELFASRPNSTAYCEVNLSPSGDWNVYHFDEYRRGMRAEEQIQSVDIVVDGEGKKRLRARLELSDLGVAASEPLELGVTAVVENADDGGQTFWALNTHRQRGELSSAGQLRHDGVKIGTEHTELDCFSAEDYHSPLQKSLDWTLAKIMMGMTN